MLLKSFADGSTAPSQLENTNQVLESRHDVQNAAKAGDVSVLRDAQVGEREKKRKRKRESHVRERKRVRHRWEGEK